MWVILYITQVNRVKGWRVFLGMRCAPATSQDLCLPLLCLHTLGGIWWSFCNQEVVSRKYPCPWMLCTVFIDVCKLDLFWVQPFGDTTVVLYHLLVDLYGLVMVLQDLESSYTLMKTDLVQNECSLPWFTKWTICCCILVYFLRLGTVVSILVCLEVCICLHRL